jgi:hypothetical protein
MEMNKSLDYYAMKYAQNIIKNTEAKVNKKIAQTIENLVTKTLEELQEQGVYASLLYLFSRSSDDEKKNSSSIRNAFYDVTEIPYFGWKIPNRNNEEVSKVLGYYIDYVTVDMDQLFLLRDTLQQMLIYARFSAKAAKIEAENKSNTDNTDLTDLYG